MHPCTRILFLLACTSAFAATARAQSVSLFGQSWQVQRFDYHQQVTWPNPVTPTDTLGLLRVESAWSLGGGHFYVGTNHQNQSPSLTYANFILEISAQTDPQGSVTGFSYVRTVVENSTSLLGSPFDLRANGLAVNPSAFGIGAGNGLVVMDGFSDFVRSYDTSTGQLVPFGQTGDGIYVAGYASDGQDLTLVTDPNPALSRLYVLDESSRGMAVFDIDGNPLSWFPVSGLADPAAGAGDPKGLAYLDSATTWPAAFHGQGGVLLVSLGDAQPGLQAFRTDGVELGYEPIDNTVFQTSSPSIKPKIESIAADPATGRLFLFMEKGSLIDNWVYVLTPDCNANGVADALEIQSGTQSDWDQDGIPDACQGETGTRFCFGDGSGTPCPCANVGPAGQGCPNSASSGASLSAAGTASVGADTIVFSSNAVPGSASVLFFQGTLQDVGGAGVQLYDGLRCVSGSAVRLGAKASVAGHAQYPGPGDVPVSVRGGIPLVGATRYYQMLYRDPGVFCTPDKANFSNGVSLTWTP